MKVFETPELKVTVFAVEDVVTTSPVTPSCPTELPED